MSAFGQPVSDPSLKLFDPAIIMAVITTGFDEENLFKMFLRRGFAVRAPGYYSILAWEYKLSEVSMRFLCLDHTKMCPSRPRNVQETEDLGAMPEFTIHFVGNQLIMPHTFFGREARWLQAREQSISITNEVLSWLREWTSAKMIVRKLKGQEAGTLVENPYYHENVGFRVDHPAIAKPQDIPLYAANMRARLDRKPVSFLASKRRVDPAIEEAYTLEVVPPK